MTSSKFIVSYVFGWALVAQSAAGYRRLGAAAWLYHPAACWITLAVYATEFLAGLVLIQGIHERAGWSQ